MPLTVIAAIDIRAVVVAIVGMIATALRCSCASAQALATLGIRGNAGAIAAKVVTAAVTVHVAGSPGDAVFYALTRTIAMSASRASCDALTAHAGQALIGVADHRLVAAQTGLRIAGARANFTDARRVTDHRCVAALPGVQATSSWAGKAGRRSCAGNRCMRTAGSGVAEVIRAEIAIVAVLRLIEAIAGDIAEDVVPRQPIAVAVGAIVSLGTANGTELDAVVDRAGATGLETSAESIAGAGPIAGHAVAAVGALRSVVRTRALLGLTGAHHRRVAGRICSSRVADRGVRRRRCHTDADGATVIALADLAIRRIVQIRAVAIGIASAIRTGLAGIGVAILAADLTLAGAFAVGRGAETVLTGGATGADMSAGAAVVVVRLGVDAPIDRAAHRSARGRAAFRPITQRATRLTGGAGGDAITQILVAGLARCGALRIRGAAGRPVRYTRVAGGTTVLPSGAFRGANSGRIAGLAIAAVGAWLRIVRTRARLRFAIAHHRRIANRVGPSPRWVTNRGIGRRLDLAGAAIAPPNLAGRRVRSRTIAVPVATAIWSGFARE